MGFRLTDNLKLYYRYTIQSRKIDYISDENPTIDINPSIENATWWNKSTGELFICIDNTPDKNKWKGSNGTIIAPSTLLVFDVFNDKSALLALTFDNNIIDLGGRKPDRIEGKIRYDTGKYNICLKSNWRSQVRFHIPEMKDLDIITVSAWIKWPGRCCVMPFGFHRYDIYFCCNYFGFNTGNSDIYGNRVNFRTNTWVHLVAKFVKGDYRLGGQIWINGEPITMNQMLSRVNTNNAVFGEYFHVFGWGANKSYRHFGYIDQLRVFNRALTDEEIQYLAHEV